MAAELITSNTGSAIDTNPVNNNEYKAWGEALTIPAEGPDYWLSSFMVSLRRYGSFSGDVWAEVYATTGTVGSDAIPMGSPLAVSAPFDSTSISTSSFQWVTLEFDETFKLEAGASYVFVVTSDTGTSSDYVSTRLTAATDHPGNAAVLYGSSWNSSSIDIQFQLYGSPDEGAEDQTLSPTGVPSGAQLGIIKLAQTLGLIGIAPTSALGTAAVIPSGATVVVTGLSSSASIGTIILVPGPRTLTLTGITSGQRFGTPSLTLGEASPVLILNGVSSNARIGVPAIELHDKILSLSSVPNNANFGAMRVRIAATRRHLYIAGVDRVGDLEKGSLRIEQALTYQIDTCSFSVKGEQPAEGEEVIVEDDKLGRLFAGIIVKVELARTFPDKSIKVWNVDCDDYTALLDRRLVVESYENMSASDIFLDIVAKYCPGFTTNGVRPGAPVIESTGAEFEYNRPSECFKWLCDYVGWHWQPDYYKDLHFFSAEELASPAPMTLVPGGKFRFGKHSIDTQGLRNRVYIRGGTMLSDPQTIQWKADGVARQWVLPWGPHEVSLTVGEVPQTVGVENLHDEAEFDYMMSFAEKYIRCSSGTTTPVEGATMALTAKQDIPVITMVEDYKSQAAIAAVQGGDGIYEHVIPDDSLVTIQAAEAAGLADLREHANPKVRGNFETEISGWKPGQIVDIRLPDRGVTGEYLIQRVTITPTWSNPSIWTFRVDYGGRLLGIADFLKALVSSQQKKRNIEPAQNIQKYVYGEESLGVSDELFTATKALPYVYGAEDAICGMVVVSDG